MKRTPPSSHRCCTIVVLVVAPSSSSQEWITHSFFHQFTNPGRQESITYSFFPRHIARSVRNALLSSSHVSRSVQDALLLSKSRCRGVVRSYSFHQLMSRSDKDALLPSRCVAVAFGTPMTSAPIFYWYCSLNNRLYSSKQFARCCSCCLRFPLFLRAVCVFLRFQFVFRLVHVCFVCFVIFPCFCASFVCLFVCLFVFVCVFVCFPTNPSTHRLALTQFVSVHTWFTLNSHLISFTLGSLIYGILTLYDGLAGIPYPIALPSPHQTNQVSKHTH